MPGQKTNYDIESGEYINIRPNAEPPHMDLWETFKVVWEVFFNSKSRLPQAELPEVKPDMAEFLRASDSLKFVWFGHSTLLLNLDQKILLIDPVFSEAASPFNFMVKRFQPAALKLEELPNIDVIVLSHDHYDHLDKKTMKYFRKKSTRFITPIGVGKHLRKWGIPNSRIVELNWGESISHDGIEFTATPAQHFSGRGFFDRNKTLWSSWVIRGSHEKIYYCGDSGYGDHFKEIGKRFGPFDIAFMENGQYNERWPDVHMQPEESIQAGLDVNAEVLVPVHWGMFDLSLHSWKEPIERIYKIAKAWEIPLITPRLGELIDIGRPRENVEWWTTAPAPQTQSTRFELVQELATK